MPDEKEPEGKAPGAEGGKKAWYDGPGSKPGSRNNQGTGEAKRDYGKKEKTWGNEKEEGGEGGGKGGGKLEKEVGIGPVYKKTFIDTEEDEEHQKKYSNKKGEHDLNYVSALNAKVSAESSRLRTIPTRRSPRRRSSAPRPSSSPCTRRLA